MARSSITPPPRLREQADNQGGKFFAILAAGTLILPAPAHGQSRHETAVLAGGCFWGVESVFEHVKGVSNVVSGLAGGSRSGVGSMRGAPAAEAVRITFDSSQVRYEELLKIFVDVAHDPTELDRQGPDVGPRYRSAIFPQNERQRTIARQYLAFLRASGLFARPVVTKIESGDFQPADSDQQDFVRKHPNERYVVINDLPKLAQLKKGYPQSWRE